jgi:subtilase family serine protease
MIKCKHRVQPGALAAFLFLAATLLAVPLSSNAGVLAQSEPALDLVIESVSWSPEIPAIDNTVTFTVAVRNQGDDPAGDYRLACFIDDYPLKNVWIYGTKPGSSVLKTFTWKALAGSHVIRAVADCDNKITESDENNNENSYAFSVLAPDLVVAAITWVPESPSISDKVTFTLTVKNEGNKISAASNVNLSIDGIFRGKRQITCLGAGENATVTFNWLATSGTHNIEGTADCLTQVKESDETNNTRVMICSSAIPDLVIDSIVWSPQNRSVSQNVTVSVKISNRGSGISNYCWLAYYIDDYLETADFVDPLKAGASVTKKYSWAAGSASHALKVVVDSREEVMENDEANNNMTITVPGILPDLIIDGISRSSQQSILSYGVTITVIVKNKGNVPSDSCDLALYVDETHVLHQEVPALMSGGTVPIPFNCIPRTDSISLRAVVDEKNFVNETSESNNSKAVKIDIPRASPNTDLTIENIGWTPGEPTLGDTVTISANIKNKGPGQAGTTHVDYYVDDVFLESVQTNTIDAGETIVNSVNWQVIPGTHTIKAVADGNNILQETDEKNNVKSAAITITAPDLAINDVRWSPVIPQQGEEVEFTVTVINQGDYKAGSAYINYYIDESARGSHIIEGIEPGATVTLSFTWRIQADSTVFKVMIDEFNNVRESEESNNSKTVFLPASDLIIEGITLSPENPTENATVTFIINIKNTGDGPARSPCLTGYIDGVFLATIQFNDIVTDGVATGACIWTAQNGEHDFRAVADEDNDIAENDEGNNEKTLTVPIGQPPEETDGEPCAEADSEEVSPSVTAKNVEIIEIPTMDDYTAEQDIAGDISSVSVADSPWWQKILTNRLVIIGIGGLGAGSLVVLMLLRRRSRNGEAKGEAVNDTGGPAEKT